MNASPTTAELRAMAEAKLRALRGAEKAIDELERQFDAKIAKARMELATPTQQLRDCLESAGLS